jgi:4-amino-4-deoxy-L-arabinose transferase-like glycosyltransferase
VTSARVPVIGAALLVAATTLSTVWVTPLFDPDEGYYPATAAESVDDGAGWDLHFNGEPRWDKPVLTYALIEGSFGVFGRTISAARLPSVIEAVALILVVGLAMGRLAGREPAAIAAFILSTTIGVQIFARVAHPEIGVVLMITAAELLAVMWLTTSDTTMRLPLALLGGVALGLGILIKGPIAIALPVLAIATSCLLLFGVAWPSAQAVGHLACCGLAAVSVALPWYAAMVSRYGVWFLHEAVWRQNVSRYEGEAFGHHSRPWFFVAPTLVALFPWSGFLPTAFVGLSRNVREPKDVLRIVMACAAVTAFVFYSVSGSKLPHYALAFLPPLAILIALRLTETRSAREMSLTVWLTATILVLAGALCLAFPFLVNRVVTARDILGTFPSASTDVTWTFEKTFWPSALLLLVMAALFLREQVPWRTVAITGAILPTILILSARPLLAQAYPWARFGAEIRDSKLPVWLVGPRAPSLSFYSGHRIRRFSSATAAEQPLPTTEMWIVAETDWLKRVTPSLGGGPRLELIDTVGGMALAKWHPAPDQ